MPKHQDKQDQLKVQGRLLLQPEDITAENWYNEFLEIHGPQTSTILKQLIDPRPFADETMEQFIQRLSLNSLRIPTHPCEQIGISKFIGVVSCMSEFAALIVNNPRTWKRCLAEALEICVRHRAATGAKLKHPTFKRPTPPSSQPSSPSHPAGNNQRPNNAVVCTHCKKRGHPESSCWDKYPHLKPASVNAFREHDGSKYVREPAESPTKSPFI